MCVWNFQLSYTGCVLSKETLFLIKFTMFPKFAVCRTPWAWQTEVWMCICVSYNGGVCQSQSGWFVALQVQGYSQVLRWGLPSSYPLPGSVEPQPLPPVCPGSSTQTAEWGMVSLWMGATASVVLLEGHWSPGKAQHHPTESRDRASVITQDKISVSGTTEKGIMYRNLYTNKVQNRAWTKKEWPEKGSAQPPENIDHQL